MHDDDVLGQDALATIRRLGGNELLTKMIDLFLGNAPRRMEAVHSAHQSGDLHALSQAAHSIKSSAGNFGARELLETAGEIEHLAGHGQSQPLPPLIAKLDAAYARVERELSKEKSSA